MLYAWPIGATEDTKWNLANRIRAEHVGDVGECPVCGRPVDGFENTTPMSTKCIELSHAGLGVRIRFDHPCVRMNGFYVCRVLGEFIVWQSATKTRGELRLLCRALGVELQEGGAE